MHLWWSRKPLATARAVLFAQLVDDPSANPERFPTDADIALERKRLHGIIEHLVAWESSTDTELLRQARQEILDSTDGEPPTILDPFSGGGTIPLEAQRLGLDVEASDLNPLAVLITKSTAEMPSRFANQPPVNPDSKALRSGSWPGSTGLADDVKYYGDWVRAEAYKRIGSLYPPAILSAGTTARVIAWIWARTVTCPNPACGITMPLTSKWWLSNKKGKEAWIVPTVTGHTVSYSIGRPPMLPPQDGGTVGRSGARCIGCDTPVDFKYIRGEGKNGRIGADLMAIVAEGKRTRHYLPPTDEHQSAADIQRPDGTPQGPIPEQAPGFRVKAYGYNSYSDLFTARQLVALMTLSDLVGAAHRRVQDDAAATGVSTGESLEEGGIGSVAYADAVATYLGMAMSRGADLNNSLVTWSHSRDQARNLFARQAIPMAWDFVEVSPFSGAAGDFGVAIGTTKDALSSLRPGSAARVAQADAQNRELSNLLISTDPPYYDNIGYSDLSDFFYVWLRRALGNVHPKLLSTILVPKAEELVANQFRHGGKAGANKFFEEGFNNIFRQARRVADDAYPVTLYYAFKQSETTADGESSTGWETFLEGITGSGWTITATWPMRSERGGRMLSIGTNALASSIVLSLRPRPTDAPRIARRSFVAALKAELPNALRELQQGAIAPVDLPQAAIGPGMGVYSRYSAVLSDDGTPMRVRAALSLINEVLDEVLSEQEGDFDPDTRFALAWFRQHGFEVGDFGDADNLARARNASLEHLERAGILRLRGTRGKVSLLSPDELEHDWDPASDTSISIWEVVMHLSQTLTKDGVPAASALLSKVPASIDPDLCKELAFLLFALAEDAKRAKIAIEFNILGTAWNDIAAGVGLLAEQGTFDYTRD